MSDVIFVPEESLLVIDGSTYEVITVGIQGPPGSGSGSSSYEYVQSTPSATWTIPHNLNRYPNITVVDNLGNVVIADKKYVSENIVQILHGSSQIGKAYIN